MPTIKALKSELKKKETELEDETRFYNRTRQMRNRTDQDDYAMGRAEGEIKSLKEAIKKLEKQIKSKSKK